MIHISIKYILLDTINSSHPGQNSLHFEADIFKYIFF